MKVLIVDDLAYIRLHLEHLLRENGHEVTLAANATEGLRQLVLDDNIDIVLTDFMLRETDGLELLRAAERALATCGRPRPTWPRFLLMTALKFEACHDAAQSERLQMAHQGGFLHVYQKPVDTEKLIADLASMRPASRAVLTS